MNSPSPEQVRMCCWARLDLMLPPKSGKYRVRNYECREGSAYFIHPDDDGQGGWTVCEGWPGGCIADWMEFDT